MSKILQTMPNADIRVLIVWEPILATDWYPPTRFTLGRIPDHRALQFWDRDHLVSAELRRSVEAQKSMTPPACCVDRDFYWDVALIFTPQQTWNKLLPAPIFWEGPVARKTSGLENSLRATLHPLASLWPPQHVICALLQE